MILTNGAYKILAMTGLERSVIRRSFSEGGLARKPALSGAEGDYHRPERA